jgi:hypothetical protein
MKKNVFYLKFNFLILFLAINYIAKSQQISLVVYDKEYQQNSSYLISDIKKITFTPGNMIIDEGLSEHELSKNEISNIEFKDVNVRALWLQEIPLTNLYPNPTVDYLNISLTKNINSGYPIKIFNANGSLVKQISTIDGNIQQIQLSELSSGIYTVQIIGNNFICSSNFIKK